EIDQEFIREILGDDFAKSVIDELGIRELPADIQANLISGLGRNIFGRVVLEILKALPKEEHGAFEAFMGSGDLDGLRAFLSRHIPDLDAFIRHEVAKEYESTKSGIHAAQQGTSA